MEPDARVGIYYCPGNDDPLFVAGAAWLGRDPSTVDASRRPDIPGIEEVTAEARGYGFHATLKPPMRLLLVRIADGRERAGGTDRAI